MKSSEFRSENRLSEKSEFGQSCSYCTASLTQPNLGATNLRDSQPPGIEPWRRFCAVIRRRKFL